MRFSSVVFDFDSTLVAVETLECVIEAALEGRPDANAVLAEIKNITEQGLRGELPFNESLSQRMALVAPHKSHVQKVADRLAEYITPSVLCHKDFFLENSDAIYIVSGGFDELIFPVSDLLGIPRAHVFANEFVYDISGVATGVNQSRFLSQHLGKVKALTSAKVPRPLVMVGDGHTDYEVKLHGVADAFIAYIEHAHRGAVAEKADCAALSFDDVRSYLEKS